MSYLRDKFKMFMSMVVEAVAATLRYKGILTTQEGNTADRRVAAANSLYCISTSGDSGNPSKTATTTLNTSLVKVATADLTTSTRYSVAAAANDDYIMFAGGLTSSSAATNIVDVFDNVLTKQSASNLLMRAGQATGVNIGEYLLIAGGQGNNNSNNYTTAYNATLTRSQPARLLQYRYNAAGIKFGDRALVIGGERSRGKYHASSDAYSPSLTRGWGPELSRAAGSPKAVLVGNNLMVFHESGTAVDVFDSTFTRTTLSNLPFDLDNQPVSVGANNEFCVIPASRYTIVYDLTLTRTDLVTDIGELRYAGGASFNGTGLIYPGRVDNTASDSIYYFQYN